MSDLPADEKAKATIFYAKNNQDKKPARSSDRSDGKGKYFSRGSDKNRDSRGRSDNRGPYKNNRNEDRGDNRNGERSDSRIETFNPKARQNFKDRVAGSVSNESPWKQRGSDERRSNNDRYGANDRSSDRSNNNHFNNERSSTDNRGARSHYRKNDKEKESVSKINQSHKQSKTETVIYSENSCRAVFNQRPDSIIKTFIVEGMAPKFKDLIKWSVDNQRGYDVVSEEALAKITGTPHHGGVAIIAKKRDIFSVNDYLNKEKEKEISAVLAVDDVVNPHNLGGLLRSAAFFNVDAVLLRNPLILESGSALRVAEGGTEYLDLIKSEDLAAGLDQFKQKEYEIVVLLPCKVAAVDSIPLSKLKFKHGNVVFVLSQQINSTLLNHATSIVHIPGSEAMSALNISVATGILLAHWQSKSK